LIWLIWKRFVQFQLDLGKNNKKKTVAGTSAGIAIFDAGW
jgi:hypothetical protein